MGQNLFRQFDLVLFHQRFAGRLALGLHERVGHGAADQQPVHELQQVLDHLDLVRHLRSAQNPDAGMGRILGALLEVLELLFHQQTRGGGLQELDDADRRGMRAVRRAKGVVDVNVAQARQLLCERGIVLFLCGVIAQVLEQQHLARRGQHFLNFWTDAIRRERDR